MNQLGIVVIGRNEGDRLERCLQSIASLKIPILYVDSASTDRSPEKALLMGIPVWKLDVSIPPNAARARNTGFQHLIKSNPDLTVIQFLDGDSRLEQGWLEAGMDELHKHKEAGIVCGAIHEFGSSHSMYRTLCEIEWTKPTGEIDTTGGIFMIRTSAFEEVHGFDPKLIAAEDDDLCLRIRRKGWKILKIDRPMALHETSVKKFSGWWRRTVRCGYAYAQGFEKHGRENERHFVHQTFSAVLWGLLLPFIAFALIPWTKGWSLLLLLGYFVLLTKIFLYSRGQNRTMKESFFYAAFCTIAKVPQCIGILKFCWDKINGKLPKIIEFKGKP